MRHRPFSGPQAGGQNQSNLSKKEQKTESISMQSLYKDTANSNGNSDTSKDKNGVLETTSIVYKELVPFIMLTVKKIEE